MSESKISHETIVPFGEKVPTENIKDYDQDKGMYLFKKENIPGSQRTQWHRPYLLKKRISSYLEFIESS